ncbi:deoxyribonuclease V [Chloroflexota bacterium]
MVVVGKPIYGYNRNMQAIESGDWPLSATEAVTIQRGLAAQVSREGEITVAKLIAGVDIATGKAGEMATGGIVIIDYPELKLVETRVVQGKLNFPYIPGLLSFRELPLILAAYEQLEHTPDLILVDGQGIAHPRRMGLASHLGLLLDMPTIGCAKSRLCGSHQAPAEEPGNYAELLDGGETIGAVLRTRQGVKPVFVSTGHKVTLKASVHWVLACCRGYRLPEPTRLAHMLASGNLEKRYVGPEADCPAMSGTNIRAMVR